MRVVRRWQSIEVQDLIKAVRRKLDGMIVITHNIEHIIKIADRVVVLRTGKRVGTIEFADYEGRSADLYNDIVKLITCAELLSVG
jgi:ABC-type sugar transport system ATPase subunit